MTTEQTNYDKKAGFMKTEPSTIEGAYISKGALADEKALSSEQKEALKKTLYWVHWLVVSTISAIAIIEWVG